MCLRPTRAEDACEHLTVLNINQIDAVKALKLGNLYSSEDMIEAAFLKVKTTYPDVKISDFLKHKPELVEEIIKKIKTFEQEIENLNQKCSSAQVEDPMSAVKD